MSEDITYCEKKDCNHMECARNPKHIKLHNIPHSFAHLEGNPMYCKKSEWNRNQYKGKEM